MKQQISKIQKTRCCKESNPGHLELSCKQGRLCDMIFQYQTAMFHLSIMTLLALVKMMQEKEKKKNVLRLTIKLHLLNYFGQSITTLIN